MENMNRPTVGLIFLLRLKDGVRNVRPPLPTFQYKKEKDCSIREFRNDLVINHKCFHWELIDAYRHLE